MPSFLSRLFGKSAPAAPEPVLYKDHRILPAPLREAGGYRLAARIERDRDGVVQVHQLTRADTFASLEEAEAAAINKAKQAIDQLGDGLFRD